MTFDSFRELRLYRLATEVVKTARGGDDSAGWAEMMSPSIAELEGLLREEYGTVFDEKRRKIGTCPRKTRKRRKPSSKS